MIKRINGDGFKIESRNGFFYFGIATRAYSFHLAVGRVSIAVSKKPKRR